MSNAVATSTIVDNKLKEIVASKKLKGESVTKVSVVAELINNAHKKECK